MEFLQRIFGRVRGWFSGIWEKTEKRDRTRFLVISGIAVVLIIAAMMMLNSGRYTELAGVDNPESRRAATAVLSDSNIRYKTSGGQLLVNKNDYDAAMTALIQSDMPIDDLDFSIYERGGGLTTTAEERRGWTKFQKQAELKRVFEALPMVEMANVIIEIPDNGRTAPWDEVQPSTVSVSLRLNGDISRAQIDTLERIVVNATNIQPQNITLNDQNLRTLNLKMDADDPVYRVERDIQIKRNFDRETERILFGMLNPLFGSANVNVIVNTILDFDQVSKESITFTPVVDDEGIPRSIQTMDEYARGTGLTDGLIGTDPNGIGDEYPEVDNMLMNEYKKSQTTTNYEINQLNESVRIAEGQVEDVFVSVTINTDNLGDTAENTAAIQSLVGTFLGYDASQFQKVNVYYAPMLGLQEEKAAEESYLARQQREQLFEFIQVLVLYIVIGACFILIIMRTFAILKPKPLEMPDELLLAGDLPDYSDVLEAATSSMELEITKTPTRERIEEFIESNPEAVASMLRNWLQEEEDRGW